MDVTVAGCEATSRCNVLPVEALIFLLGSRYCETDRLSDIAWDLFGHLPKGWPLVQAICDFAHDRIKFGYEHANPTKTAFDAYTEGRGVCRDYAHLAVTFCRCMNIPARYCTGYLGDMGTEPPYGPGDFAAWFEAYLGGRWYIVRSAQQCSAPRPHPDGARARRDRRRDGDVVRPVQARELPRVHRRGGRSRLTASGRLRLAAAAAGRTLGPGGPPGTSR